jgi:signal transduction histidine kinase
VETANLSSRSQADRVTWVWQVLLLTALYAAVGLLGLKFTHYENNSTLVWPSSGLALAALILFGRRLWLGIFIGTLVVGVYDPLGWLTSLVGAVGNTLEALVGATLLVRVADFRPTLERLRDGVAFLLIGVVGCTTISATIGSISMLLFGDLEAIGVGFWEVWLVWWLGGAGGVLILTPVLLISMHGTPSWMSLIRRLESWLIFAILIGASLVAFFGSGVGLLGLAAFVSPFPALVWAGTRLGSRGAVMASFLIILIAIIAAGTGFGPAMNGTTAEAMFLLWSYSIFIAISAFTLAAVVGQRDAADRRFRSEEVERLSTEKQRLLLLERERLTREMHDGLGGQLVSILSMAERGLAAPSELAEALRRAIDDIRIVIDSIDPDTMDLPTSLGQLRARLEPLLRRNGIDLRWNIEEIPGIDAFPPEAALHLLRIVQEAVTNSLRHANANHVEVRLSSTGGTRGQLHVSVRDDGLGLAPEMSSGGRGIKNMNSRAEELGAVLRIENMNPGTQIDLAIPFPQSSPDSRMTVR